MFVFENKSDEHICQVFKVNTSQYCGCTPCKNLLRKIRLKAGCYVLLEKI